MPLRSCIICRAEKSPEIQLQYCAVSKSALYCSEACQKQDWKKHHKKMCKLLNVGHGDMQVRSAFHTSNSIHLKGALESQKRMLDERFFKIFEESTFEGSQAAAQKMKTYARRQTKYNQTFLLFHSLRFLIQSDSEMLSWPNSPLLVLFQFFDPNVLSGDEDESMQDG
jgi:hypothetical protein